jgi:iron complex transport system substrate-binding protein
MSQRIASLLPSASEIVTLLGLAGSLVGRTHECDFPPCIEEVPVLTYASLHGAHLSSREIDRLVSESLGDAHQGSTIYGIVEEAWRAASPDLVLTQELCDVCAVNYNRVVEAARLLEGETLIVSLEPTVLSQMLENIRTVGELTGTGERAAVVIAELESRIDSLRSSTASLSRRRVVCIEWLDPIFSAGHWVPQQVMLAGGAEQIGLIGERSGRKSWQDVVAAQPEILILLPCGFEVERTLAEVDVLVQQSGWYELPAVQRGEVYAVNGHAYFNRPGPRLVDGAELLAGLFHPEQFAHFREQFAAEGAWLPVMT